MWFKFRQNNSGGGFDIDADSGLGTTVWIEADSANSANRKAKKIGIYFDGVHNGTDCECCGDRWTEVDEDDGEQKPYLGMIVGNVYLHPKTKDVGFVVVDNKDDYEAIVEALVGE